MHRRRFAGALAGTLASAAFARGAGAQTRELHVGVSPFEQHADAYYAREQGFFKQAGIDADVQLFTSGGAIAAAVAGGALQVAAANPLPVFQAHERGLDFVIVAPGALYDSRTYPANFVVAPNSTRKTGKDFEGTTIAVTSLSGLDPLGARAWIDKTGGDSRTVKFIELGHAAEADAVASGRVAAALIADPSVPIAEGKVRALTHSYDALGNHFFAAVWFAKRSWADADPDLVRRFRTAIDRAGDWATRNPLAAAAILKKDMNVVVDRAHEVHARTVETWMLQPLIDSCVKYGFLKNTMNASDVVWSAPNG